MQQSKSFLSFESIIAAFVSAGLGAAGATSLAQRLPFFWEMTRTARLYAVGLALLLALVLLYPLWRLARAVRKTIPRIDVLFLILFSLMLGLILRNILSFLNPPLSPLYPFQLEISAGNRKNSASQGYEIGLVGVKVNDVKVPFSAFETQGVWKEKDGVLYAAPEQLEGLKYIRQEVPLYWREVWELDFLSGPKAGKIRIEPYHLDVDLYSPEIGHKRFPLVVYLQKVWFYTDAFWIGFLIFLAGAAAMRRMPGKAEQKWSLWDLGAALTLAGLVFVICLVMAQRGSHFGFVDMAHDGYQLCTALDIQRGGVLFRDTFTQYGILPDNINALALNLFGKRLFSLKIMTGLIYALIMVCQYFVTRSLLPRGPAFLSGLVLLFLGPQWDHGVMVSAHVYSVLFQAVSVLLLLVSLRRPGWSWVAGAGAAAGLMFGMKQNIGVFHLAALLLFVFLWQLMTEETPALPIRIRLMRFLRESGVLLAGFCGVMIVFLTWLMANGALQDWWTQTILLPGAYAFGEAGGPALGGGILPPGITALLNKGIGFFSAFVEEQTKLIVTQTLERNVGFIIRFTILGVGLWQLCLGRRRNWGVVLLAITALFAWLGLMPSAQIMHQWASLVAPFAVIGWLLWKGVSSSRFRGVYYAAITAVVFLPLIGSNIMHVVTENETEIWREEIQTPILLQGIRTDPATAQFFRTAADEIKAYQVVHSGAAVLVLDDPWKGSLLIQALQGRCALFHPAYWDVEHKISQLYPDYLEKRKRYIQENQPLLILTYDPDDSKKEPDKIDLQELHYHVYKTVLRDVKDQRGLEKVLYSFAYSGQSIALIVVGRKKCTILDGESYVWERRKHH